MSQNCQIAVLWAGTLALLFAPTRVSAETDADRRIMAGAEARIEQHRKADGTVLVVNAEGQPVEGVQVRIQQTRHAFLFGSNIFAWDKIRDPEIQTAYRRRFAELLNYATLPYYWPSYEPTRGMPQHDRYEQVARWCHEHRITTKGHPLAWNYSDPRWLPGDLDEVYRLQLERVGDCVTRMQGHIDRWDVVNEATQFDRDEMRGRAPKLTAMWQHVGQLDFAKACFLRARKAGPGAELLINDYRTDPAYERLVTQLVDDSGKRLYDVIGLQSHMHSQVWSNEKLYDVPERFSRFGVPLHFTELTILSGEEVGRKERDQPWPSTPAGEAKQAREIVRCYTVLFSHPAVEAITWWDFCDLNAWKGAPAGLLRKDGSPKPAYNALSRLIKGKWWTDQTVASSAEGIVRFRGFRGDYLVTVSDAAGSATELRMSLGKEGENEWKIVLP